MRQSDARRSLDEAARHDARHGASRVRNAVEAQASAWGGLRSRSSPDESAVIDEFKTNLPAAQDGRAMPSPKHGGCDK
ncbi:hypothetical protein CORC01_10047 [Colletotrichum orchidophilum]|uniref:Uncharacterized protein n=1 Tax=Colletotrichum orchidophilum TaxID=1209926 RepID=A0A1G4AZV8_9PEZI|nr:uncharacterized protein CORC01_10047 [Colletotrichum orchidophilum]OHE94646.1 hypothetical protein CORC01_10047 [Colletotrichum orchidophilum]